MKKLSAKSPKKASKKLSKKVATKKPAAKKLVRAPVKATAKTQKKAEAPKKKSAGGFDQKIFKPTPRSLTRSSRKDGATEIMRVGDSLEVYLIHGVASFVWSQLDGEIPVGGILEQVLDQYDVSEAEARMDVTGFIKTLVKMELVQEV